MRGSHLIVFSAASSISCAQALYSTARTLSSSEEGHYRCGTRSTSKYELNRRLWFLAGGGAEGENYPQQAAVPTNAADAPVRWWRLRKRRAARQAEMKAREAHAAIPKVQLRKHVVLAKDILRRLRRWWSVVVDIITLKRLRQRRQARQVWGAVAALLRLVVP